MLGLRLEHVWTVASSQRALHRHLVIWDALRGNINLLLFQDLAWSYTLVDDSVLLGLQSCLGELERRVLLDRSNSRVADCIDRRYDGGLFVYTLPYLNNQIWWLNCRCKTVVTLHFGILPEYWLIQLSPLICFLVASIPVFFEGVVLLLFVKHISRVVKSIFSVCDNHARVQLFAVSIVYVQRVEEVLF